MAAEIGSDVPLFLIGGAVLGVGRGEEVYPLPDLPSCVRRRPAGSQRFHAAGLSRLGRRGTALTPTRPVSYNRRVESVSRCCIGEPHSSGVFPERLREDLAENPLLALVRTGIENDFEEVVFPQYPLLGDIKRILAV